MKRFSTCVEFKGNAWKNSFWWNDSKGNNKTVVKYLEAIKKKQSEEKLFACGYDTGSTDNGICRELQKAGYGC